MKQWPRPGHREQRSRARYGFDRAFSQTAASLLEALFVVALLLILTTLYWGSSSESRQRQRLRACQHNLESVFMALQIYANDQRGAFPAVTNAERSEEPLALLVPRCTTDTSVFLCPSSKDAPLPQGLPFSNGRISYAYYMGRRTADNPEVLVTDRQVDTRPKAQGQQLFSPDGRAPGNNHGADGGNLLFADGRISTSPPSAGSWLSLTQGVVLLNP